MAPLSPSPSKLRFSLWAQFVSDPVNFARLLRELEDVKAMTEEEVEAELEAMAEVDRERSETMSKTVTGTEFMGSKGEVQREIEAAEQRNVEHVSRELDQQSLEATEILPRPLTAPHESMTSPCILMTSPPLTERTPNTSLTSPPRSLVSPLLPPMSPRTPRSSESSRKEEEEEEEETIATFILENNIDQVPERSLWSPRDSPRCSRRHNNTCDNKQSTKQGTAQDSKDDIQHDIHSIYSNISINKQTLTAATESSTSSSTTEDTISTSITNVITMSSVTRDNFPHTNTLQTSSTSPPPPPPPRHSSLTIPPFYRPLTTPPPLPSSLTTSVEALFSSLPSGQVTRLTCEPLTILLGFSPLLSNTLFNCVFGDGCQEGSCQQLLAFWQLHSHQLSEDSCDRLFHLVEGCTGREVTAGQLSVLVESVLLQHPQLQFFRDADCPSLHEAYVTCVVASLIFEAGGGQRRQLNRRQFSSLHLTSLLEKLSDSRHNLNNLPHFSYDHFYVFYVKLVELCPQLEEGLTQQQLLEFEEEGHLLLSRRLVERVFAVCVRGERMQLDEWVTFLSSVIEPSALPAQNFWFQVFDTLHDGVLSLDELLPFYTDSVALFVAESDCAAAVDLVPPWLDIARQLLDTPSCTSNDSCSSMTAWSRLSLRRNPKFAHIIDCFVNLPRFLAEDNDDTIRDTNTVNNYVMKTIVFL